ncbi:MAG: nitroreductase family protein [Prevotella sp.]|nr:nitroreductase family protein [Prevotella sp.]
MKMLRLLLAVALATTLTACNGQSEVKNESNDNGMLETIMTRTSIRQYTDQPVEKEKIEAMLRAGMAAPTAVNAQPWHFVVVSDKAKLGELAAANPRAGMLKSAPLAIVVCGDMTKAMEGKGRQFWIQDCSAATENILLAAHAQGLGAVWTALYPMEERMQPVSEALKLPDTLIPLCTVVIGYPAEQPEPKDKWKPENISYNEYGNKE